MRARDRTPRDRRKKQCRHCYPTYSVTDKTSMAVHLKIITKCLPPRERESWDECKALIAGVRAAGSWKAFDRVPRKAVIRLRSLYARGRATTADPIMKFLCELGDNGIVWNVLSFWRGERARPY